MQFSTRTDYAIRILVFLSESRETESVRDMALSLGIAESYLPKVLRPLREVGWISSTTGVAGGYTLQIPPEKISLWSVMEVMEDTVKCNRCLETDGYCSRYASENCPMHNVYAIYQRLSETLFGQLTIADVRRRDSVEGALERFCETMKNMELKGSTYGG